MNILVISHYAGTPQYGMEYRSYYMAREWVGMGHQVTVVGASFSHIIQLADLIMVDVQIFGRDAQLEGSITDLGGKDVFGKPFGNRLVGSGKGCVVNILPFLDKLTDSTAQAQFAVVGMRC